MKPKKRQKMCYNCDGEVDLEVIVCPLCAADLRAEKPEQQRPSYSQTASVKNLGTEQSLYPPHYSPKVAVQEEEPVMEEPPSIVEEPQEESKNIVGPTILIALGVQLLLFGMLLLCFSHKGVLLLKWDSRLWFLYIFASIPLLIFGYRALSKT